MMKIHKCNKEYFDFILSNLNDFWEVKEDEEKRYNIIKILHHPMVIYEMGDSSLVAVDNGFVSGYLFGFIAKQRDRRHAYVHMISTHKDYRKRGIAKMLYAEFENLARENHCDYIKAITRPENTVSIRFHMAIVMECLGIPNADGINVIANYAGPNDGDRVVFNKTLRQNT